MLDPNSLAQLKVKETRQVVQWNFDLRHIILMIAHPQNVKPPSSQPLLCLVNHPITFWSHILAVGNST